MATLFTGPYYQAIDGDGNPISNGSVYFYEPGTSTKKDVYTDSALTTPASNPVTTDSAGKVQVFLNGNYKVRVEDANGNLLDEQDNVNPEITTETSGGNLVANGSFEIAGNTPDQAEGWTLTPQNDGTIERITSDNYDGDSALKMTSTGNGGGQADTNSFFEVSPGYNYGVAFAINASVADIRNLVEVRWFDASQTFLSKTTVYDENASNPTSWTAKKFEVTPPSSARFAKIRLIGADKSDSTSGDVKFDAVRFSNGDNRFPNVDADVTATDEDLDILSGAASSTPVGGIAYIEQNLTQLVNDGTADQSWQEGDAGTVPSGTKAILVFFELGTNGSYTGLQTVWLALRKKGSSASNFNTKVGDQISEFVNNAASTQVRGQAIVGIDSNGKFEYNGYADTSSFDDVDIYRVGYIK